MKDNAKPQLLNGDLHNLPPALAPLVAQDKWLMWRWERVKDKWTKPPYQPSGARAKNNDPKTWNSYATAMEALPRWDGIGHCLLNGDIAAFDIDDCRDPNSGSIDPWAIALVERAKSYAEITVSGTGLRIIGRGIGPTIQRKFPVNGALSCEVYRNCARYIVVTGNPLPFASLSLANIDEVIDTIVCEFDSKRKTKGKEQQQQPGQEEDKLEKIIRDGEGGYYDGDRSDAVWFVINQMLRRGYREEAILIQLLDKRNEISAHIYDQANPHEYAKRQITKAINAIRLEGTNNVPFKTPDNICVALLKLKITLRYDEFADRMLITGLPGFGPVLEDAACDRLWLQLKRLFRLHVSQELLRTVVSDVAHLNSFHPIRDYFNDLRWDGKPRIDTWFIDYGGAEDTEYTRAVGALMLIAAVRRVRRPGCKFDEMVVIENEEQGTNKSTALATLAVREDWFSDDLPLNISGKEVIERLRGRWIIEAAELSGIRRTEIEHLKAFLSRQTDRGRMAYGHFVTEVPRQCIIVGTTNAFEYLKDTTGNRRFWPVLVKQFNIAELRHNRDQLWAEAAAREADEASIRLDQKLWSKAAEQQEQRLTRDPWFDILQASLSPEREAEFWGVKISTASIWEILDVRGGHQTQDQSRRVSDAMRQLGWKRANSARTIKLDGKDVVGWVRGAHPWRAIRIRRDMEGRPYCVVDPDAQG
jgi:hypothetical protein